MTELAWRLVVRPEDVLHRPIAGTVEDVLLVRAHHACRIAGGVRRANWNAIHLQAHDGVGKVLPLAVRRLRTLGAVSGGKEETALTVGSRSGRSLPQPTTVQTVVQRIATVLLIPDASPRTQVDQRAGVERVDPALI